MEKLRGALCAGQDPERWFPLDEDGPGSARPRAVCAACPAREGCLQVALADGHDVGIWGGLSGRERRQLKRPGRAAA